MSISASMVKELREKTGAGMMDCKKALSATDGDMEKAIEELRKKGMSAAAKKAGRATGEGLVHAYIHPGGSVGVLVEVNCETDFVARTDQFVSFCNDVAMHIAATDPKAVSEDELDAAMLEKERKFLVEQAQAEGKPAEIAEKMVEGRMKKYKKEIVLLEQPFVKDPDQTVGDLVKSTIAGLGENIQVRRFSRFQVGA